MKPISVWCYQIYAVMMMLMWFLVALSGLYFVVFGFSGSVFSPEEEQRIILYSYFSLFVGTPTWLLFGASLFLPRAMWSWIVHLVLIGVGSMMFWCFWPISLPLLIVYVMSSATREWYVNPDM